ncbi:MAG: MFS transporter, partial [Cutibacterium acnes]
MFTLPPLFTAWWGAVTKASDASLGWVTTCAVLASGMLTYVAGIVRQQVGTRWMYVLATVLMLVSLAVVLVNPRSLPIAYVWALLSGASSAFTYSPSLTAVQEWFPRRLGLVTGLVNASFALPAAAAAPIVAVMLRNWGFTATVLTFMVAVALTQMVVIFLSTPYWLENKHAEELAVARREISGPAVTTAQAVRTPAFWQVWAMWLAGGGAAITMMIFAATYSSHLNDIGVQVSAVAAVTAFVSGNGLIRVVNAMLLDHIGPTVIGGVTSVTLAFGYML